MSNRKVVIKVVQFLMQEYGLPQSRPTILKKYFEKHPEDDTPDVEVRKARFREEMLAFRGEFPDDILKSFFEYWSEKSTNSKKMRFERERVFDYRRRLTTWWKNDVTQFGKNPEKWNSKEDKPMDALEINKERPWNKIATR